MQILPQLRALRQESNEPMQSEGSNSSAASPRSWPIRVHPYRPVDGSMERSSFELVPSSIIQAPCASGMEDSLNVTPIPRASSSPSLYPIPIQVMNSNLATGSASSATPPARDEGGFDPDVARSILQQRAEAKGEDGTVERVFTQVVQTWPLTENVKFENIEAAMQALRQVCDYLYQGLSHAGPRLSRRRTPRRRRR